MEKKHHSKASALKLTTIFLLIIAFSNLCLANNVADIAAEQEAVGKELDDRDNDGPMDTREDSEHLQSWYSNSIKFIQDFGIGISNTVNNFGQIPTIISQNAQRTAAQISNSQISSAIASALGYASSPPSESPTSSHEPVDYKAEWNRRYGTSPNPYYISPSPEPISSQEPFDYEAAWNMRHGTSPNPYYISPSPEPTSSQEPFDYEAAWNMRHGTSPNPHFKGPKHEEPPIIIINRNANVTKISKNDFIRFIVIPKVNKSREVIIDPINRRNINLKLNSLYMSNDALSR